MPSTSKEIIELPAEQLRTGIYVSRLDRPWTDTPFLFQGFIVDNDEDLQTLQRLCKTVYVEVTREEEAELRARARKKLAAVDTPPAAPDLLAALNKDPASLLDRVPTKDSVPFKNELSAAEATYKDARRAVGAVFDHLRKGGRLDMPQLETVVGPMVDSVFRNRDALGWLSRMKSKDDYLYSHSLAVSVWALAFGRHLGLDKDTLKIVGTGAMLLDIGKTKLSNELLRKPGRPNAEEWQLIRKHVEEGISLLRSEKGVDERVLSMVSTHHERMDGTGYPGSLKGEAIPLVGRIAGIVDAYDAMISERSYAKPKSTYDAVRELKHLGGSAFAPELVELFIQAVGVFPTGTLVELNTGEVGVVIAQNRFRRLRPEVMLVLDAQKQVRSDFTSVNLLTRGEGSSTTEPSLWITRGLEHGAYGIDPKEYFL